MLSAKSGRGAVAQSEIRLCLGGGGTYPREKFLTPVRIKTVQN